MITATLLLLLLLTCLALNLPPTWSDETQPARNALVFHGRNQDYGAYRIRMDYGRRMALAYLTAFGLMAGLAVWPMMIADRQMPPIAVSPPPREFSGTIVLPPIDPPPVPVKHRTTSVTKPPGGSSSTVFLPVDTLAPPLKLPVDPVPVTSASSTETGSATGRADHAADSAASTGSSMAAPVVREAFEVDRLPVFPGGDAAMRHWVQDHLDFPTGLTGKDQVVVLFTVGLDGLVTDVKALTGTAAACKEAAARVVAGMPRWKPARSGGRDVPCRMTLPIRFEVR